MKQIKRIIKTQLKPLNPHMPAMFQNWIRQGNASPIEFLIEGIDNELEYGKSRFIKIIILRNTSKPLIILKGFGTGMTNNGWNFFTNSLFKNCSQKSSVGGIGLFGEGLRRTAFSLSIAQNKEFWVCSNNNGHIENALFIWNPKTGLPSRQLSYPMWANNLENERRSKNGVTIAVPYLCSNQEISEIKNVLSDTYAYNLYNNILRIKLEVIDNNTKISYPIDFPNYGTNQVKHVSLGKQITGTIFENPTAGNDSGAIKFYFKGRKVYEPQRKRISAIAWIDISNLSGIRVNLTTRKNGFKTGFQTSKIDPLIYQIYKNYSISGVSSNTVSTLANNLYKKAIKAINVGMKRPRKIAEFLFRCTNPFCSFNLKNKKPFEIFSLINCPLNCPHCSSILTWIPTIKYPPNPTGRQNNTQQIAWSVQSFNGLHFVFYSFPSVIIDSKHPLYHKFLNMTSKGQGRILGAYIAEVAEIANSPSQRNSSSVTQDLQLRLDRIARVNLALESI